MDADGIKTKHQSLLLQVSPFKGKQFKKCSVVGNSGLLVNSMCGFAVDDAEYVFR